MIAPTRKKGMPSELGGNQERVRTTAVPQAQLPERKIGGQTAGGKERRRMHKCLKKAFIVGSGAFQNYHQKRPSTISLLGGADRKDELAVSRHALVKKILSGCPGCALWLQHLRLRLAKSLGRPEASTSLAHSRLFFKIRRKV